jgi:hypothetical protein
LDTFVPFHHGGSVAEVRTMKAVLLAFLILGSSSAVAKHLVVLADIALMPDSAYAKMKEPDCDEPTESGDLFVLCIGGWTRYRLTGVTLLNGTRWRTRLH